MAERKRSLVRSTSLALGAGAIVLLAIVVSIVYLVYQTQAYVESAARARQLRSSAADLLLAVQDAETGQRGYLLTREKSFLDPYITSIGELGKREATFEAALAGSDFIEVEPAFIKMTIDNKISELQRTLALAQAGRQAEALQVVQQENGLRLMNNIRTTLTGIIEASDRRINDQFVRNLDLAALLRITTILGAITVIAIMAGVVVVIRRYVREIAAARTEMEGLNAGLEERVKERTDDLIRANQEIQRYAYIVTHDLRAPLVNIMGFTSELDNALKTINAYFRDEGGMMEEDAKRNAMLAVEEDLPEAISFIRSSTRKMDDLINAILKISRDGRRQLKPERLDLEALIETSTAAIQHQVVEADGEINVSVKVRNFVSDKFSVEQILGNLFDNAVKYKEPSRPLKLDVHAFQLNRFTVGIDVADNGRGVAAEDHERIFDLFRRSGAQDSPGEGIGLAQVRSLIRNMGGDVHVKSELGKGTTFMIRLPSNLSQYVGSHGQ
jgi:signal transduction histidine kinase